MYDSIVIGAGIAGSIAARELSERGGQKVLLLEKRSHIGGNCYDELDENGILIHRYGPHIFHTDLDHVFAYLSRFTDWRFFGHKVVADIYGQLVPVPFNLNTLHAVYEPEKAKRLEKKLVDAFGEGSRIPILKLRESSDEEIQEVAQYVYDNVFLKYTMKQWGQTPEEVDPAVTGRVPVLISRDDRYFQDKYQGMPKDGYTAMFEAMLDHPGIEIRLETDVRDLLKIEKDQILLEGQPFSGDVIYTGQIDELLGERYGMLPYRSLDFCFEHHQEEDFQGHSVVNYTVSEDYTRITEFKHLTGQKASGTTIVKEYPKAYADPKRQIPYYAISNPQNNRMYEMYKGELAGLSNFHLLGRLAEYKYYNIDAMADRALALAEMILKR